MLASFVSQGQNFLKYQYGRLRGGIYWIKQSTWFIFVYIYLLSFVYIQ